MPLLWTAGVNTGRLTKEEFVAVTSSNIARILNIYPRKGRLAIGSDADIVVWDPCRPARPSVPRASWSRIDYNVFEGFSCTGAPIAIVSRGKLALRQMAICVRAVEKGDGKYNRTAAISPVHVANSTWKQVDRAAAGAAGGSDAVSDLSPSPAPSRTQP